MLSEFVSEPNANARLEHELICFEEGPLSCKRSHGCILVQKSCTQQHWQRLIELPHGRDASRLVGPADTDGCHVEAHQNKANDEPAVCDPFLLAYGPEPAKVKQAAQKIARALSSSFHHNNATKIKRPACQGENSLTERQMKVARTSCDNLATSVQSCNQFELEITIPDWLFKSRTRIYEHLFGAQPDSLVKRLAQICCTLHRPQNGGTNILVIRPNVTVSEGRAIRLVEDSLLHILSMEGDGRANDRLLYDLSPQYRHNKGYSDILQIRDLDEDPLNHPKLWAWARELPVQNRTIDHGFFLKHIKQDGVDIIILHGGGSHMAKPKLCRPYIIVKGRKRNPVEQAVEAIHLSMIKHQDKCNCVPKWQPWKRT